ncbi:MAG TPA: hypothetical protein VMN58_00470 [Acidimicrobiales bacterium]|nr:hypothetical protein [Acidimicrobiales bacterium]
MEHSVAVRPDDLDAPPAVAATIAVPPADAFVRRLLRVPVGGPRSSLSSARNAFSASLAVSTVRCLLTYVLLPIAGPVLGLTGAVGPLLGITVGLVSTVAIIVSMRRFWAADHRMRWGYTAIGGGILVLLAVQAVGDLRTLLW